MHCRPHTEFFVTGCQIQVFLAHIVKYEHGHGLKWHHDMDYVTAIVPMNLGFSGGSLSIKEYNTLNEFNLSYAQGDVMIFTGGVVHKASPVLSGERWITSIFYQRNYSNHMCSVDTAGMNTRCNEVDVESANVFRQVNFSG